MCNWLKYSPYITTAKLLSYHDRELWPFPTKTVSQFILEAKCLFVPELKESPHSSLEIAHAETCVLWLQCNQNINQFILEAKYVLISNLKILSWGVSETLHSQHSQGWSQPSSWTTWKHNKVSTNVADHAMAGGQHQSHCQSPINTDNNMIQK